VLDDGRIVGFIDEWDMLQAVFADKSAFDAPVSQFMITDLEFVDVNASVDSLMPIFSKDLVAIVMDNDQFLGIITRIDLINYLRQHSE
jgi:cystathionine beta-synthase